jgi:phosphoserine phosphatase
LLHPQTVARLVVFDMDGVLADIQSSWVYVHDHFGVNNDHSLYAYLRGEIDDLEFIRRDIHLWKDRDPEVSIDMIRRILASVPLMPGALQAVRQLRESGLKTAIVSAGIDILAERIVDELDIDHQLANGLITDTKGKLSGEGVLRVKLMDKGDAVAQVGRLFRVKPKDIVSVGNSHYDVSMFSRSGKGIAFHPSDEGVKESADAIVEGEDLSGILKFV